MDLNLLMTFALMNGVKTFTCGKEERTKESCPRVVVAWCCYLDLFPGRRISLTNFRTPMQVSAVKVNQVGSFGRLGFVTLLGIVAG